ncbi:aldo/keto reductase [Oenococcus sicerae]|uniref:Aldo/keto reductase n=1 Tax=Oenococcus sicerae TaxID=2203724 RepID=A0AAE5WKK9_9LACO|nr:aldo/keto reductase [Oenococcus sicerae]MDN6900606.1 aldo/keto reductase [Oenococcus sicerae]QAS69378.1 aldo/keto reductase [Oenococcus sicerae]VDK14555.1 Glyoxal reductase [Oenococcus sicerae]
MAILTDTYTLNNGTKIPKVGFGTWQTPDGDVAYQAVSNALKAGYRHIDTAQNYRNERSVGKAIADSDVDRDDLWITTKLPAEDKKRDAILADFDHSLAALGLDYLDLYLIHAPWPWREAASRHFDAENTETWQTLEELQKSGRVKSIGISNFDVHDMKNILNIAEIKPVVNQVQYYIGFTEPKIAAYAAANDIRLEAYSPLATGDILNSKAVRDIADKYSVSVARLALRFTLQNGTITLPKAISETHIQENTQLDFTISASDMTLLNALPDAAPDHFHNATQG